MDKYQKDPTCDLCGAVLTINTLAIVWKDDYDVNNPVWPPVITDLRFVCQRRCDRNKSFTSSTGPSMCSDWEAAYYLHKFTSGEFYQFKSPELQGKTVSRLRALGTRFDKAPSWMVEAVGA